MADKSLDPNFNKYGELTSFDPTWRMQTRDVIANYLQDLGLASTRQAALDMAEGFTGSPDAVLKDAFRPLQASKRSCHSFFFD